MLVSGYFRLPNDIPKPVWRYPMSYISFHFWALQVKQLQFVILLQINVWFPTHKIMEWQTEWKILPSLLTITCYWNVSQRIETKICMFELQGQYQNDLAGLLFDNQTPDQFKIPGEYILENVFQIDTSRSKWIDLSVIFCMIVAYRIIFFIMIKFSEDVTPWIRGYMARRRLQQKNGIQNTTVAPDGLTQSPSLRTYATGKRLTR